MYQIATTASEYYTAEKTIAVAVLLVCVCIGLFIAMIYVAAGGYKKEYIASLSDEERIAFLDMTSEQQDDLIADYLERKKQLRLQQIGLRRQK